MEFEEEIACKRIIKFDKTMKKLFVENPLRKALMGKYGEFLVIKEFKKRGFDVKTYGNLTSYDLLVNGNKIEVRTSEIKKERAFPKNISAWGWKLQTRKREGEPREIGYDYIILVQLHDTWEKHKLFLFSKDEIEKMKTTSFSGYQTVARAIYLFKNKIEEAINCDKNKMITKECIEFNKNPKKHLVDWKKLRKFLK